MAGASIPYPVNYVINFIVLLLFAIILLILALFRYYKSQAARASRKQLTGRPCLNLNMEGVEGYYPPVVIDRLIKENEMRRLSEAEAAAKEYEIVTDITKAQDYQGSGLLDKPQVKGDQSSTSDMAIRPSGSDAVKEHRKNSAPKVGLPVIQEPHAEDVGPAAAPVEGGVVPTLVLPTEQDTETGGDVTESHPDTASGGREFAAKVVTILPNVADSRKSAPQRRVPEVTTVSTATQTSPDHMEPELSDVDSVVGSFEDSEFSE